MSRISTRKFEEARARLAANAAAPRESQADGFPTVEIFEGDALAVLQTLPTSSVHAIVTSPPYWQMRDYEVAGQVGRERSRDQFIGSLVRIFHEARRVLRRDGTCWINIGDTFKNHQLQLVPFRLAEALQEDGWTLRCDIIWNKPNATPESVVSRPSRSHEYIFMLSKEPRNYFFDYAAILEPQTSPPPSSAKIAAGKRGKWAERVEAHGGFSAWNPRGRRRRSVWSVPTASFRPERIGVDDVTHFAMFPPRLIEPIILAATSSFGVCSECGAPYRRVLCDAEELEDTWVPTCSCPPGPVSRPIVLDMFGGSGTTADKSIELGRSAQLIELNPAFARLARARTRAALDAYLAPDNAG